MRDLQLSLMVSAIVAVAFTSGAAAQLAAPADPGFAAMEAQQNAANAKAGPRVVPGRMIPVPNTVSPQLTRAGMTIDAGGRRSGSWSEGIFGGEPADVDEMACFLAGVVRKKFGLTLQSEKTDGERVYRVIGDEAEASTSAQPQAA